MKPKLHVTYTVSEFTGETMSGGNFGPDRPVLVLAKHLTAEVWWLPDKNPLELIKKHWIKFGSLYLDRKKFCSCAKLEGISFGKSDVFNFENNQRVIIFGDMPIQTLDF